MQADAGTDVALPPPDAEPDLGSEIKETPGPGADAAGEDVTVVPEDLPPPPPVVCAKDGEACDDGDLCTTGDVCKDGECHGAAYTCSDGIGCTRDDCDGLGGCAFPIKGDRCLIGGACYEDGDPAPGGCQSCVVPVSQAGWTADDTLLCDDDDFCTSGDHCFGGVCVGGGAKDCEDGNWCTDDGCASGKGCTHAPNDRACSDGDPCTVGDTCTNSKCLAGSTIVTCDDDEPCTDDLCLEEEGGCVHVPSAQPCDDGSLCTLGDHCQGGTCQGGAGALACSDTNPCTDDLCHAKKGCWFKYNQAACSDGDPCSTGDVCAYGTCQKGPFQTPCNDQNPCTKDMCSPQTGQCVHPPDNAAACTDQNPCTVGDFCEAGVCKSGGAKVVCDDGSLCTDDDCAPDGTCTFVPNVLPCDDGDPCTLGDACIDGACTPGLDALACSDKKPCTDDYCEPKKGCVHSPNNDACNDGNACTVGDQCLNGQCAPGSQLANCDDQNPCTDDACASKAGCVFSPNGFACSDGEPCTENDHCQGGVCVGVNNECDDKNECTKEICLGGGKCDHVPIESFECKPKITFVYPPRGAHITGPGPVVATGTVKVGGAGLKDFFVNGINVPVDANGVFAVVLQPQVGLNIIQSVATSKLGGQAKGIRAYAWTTEWFPYGATIPDALAIWLSQQVWDDNNTSDIDDIATVMTLVLNSYDIPSLVPNPLTTANVLGCGYTVNAAPFTLGQPSVDLTTINGALHVRVRYPNLYVGLKASAGGWLCPTISGKVTASYMQVDLDLVITSQPDGSVKVSMANGGATVAGLNVEIDGILGFLFNWIIDFFEGTIAGTLESMVMKQLSIVPETLGNALESLALNQQFDLPSFIGDGPPTTLTLKSQLSSADFDQFGGFLAMGTSVTSGEKLMAYETPGSLGRAKCLKKTDFFDFLMQAEIEIALKDDLLNQLLFAAWWHGAFEIPLPKSLLGDVDLSAYGVSVNDLTLSFMLPPIVSSCNPEEQLVLGIGDIKVHASLVLFGNPLEVDAYASGLVNAQLAAQEGPNGNTLAILLEDVTLLDVEVGQVSAGFEGAQGAISDLISQNLVPAFFGNFSGKALGGLPIPSIPLDGFSSAVPSGTKLELDLKKAYRLGGRSVMAGNAK